MSHERHARVDLMCGLHVVSDDGAPLPLAHADSLPNRTPSSLLTDAPPPVPIPYVAPPVTLIHDSPSSLPTDAPPSVPIPYVAPPVTPIHVSPRCASFAPPNCNVTSPPSSVTLLSAHQSPRVQPSCVVPLTPTIHAPTQSGPVRTVKHSSSNGISHVISECKPPPIPIPYIAPPLFPSLVTPQHVPVLLSSHVNSSSKSAHTNLAFDILSTCRRCPTRDPSVAPQSAPPTQSKAVVPTACTAATNGGHRRNSTDGLEHLASVIVAQQRAGSSSQNVSPTDEEAIRVHPECATCQCYPGERFCPRCPMEFERASEAVAHFGTHVRLFGCAQCEYRGSSATRLRTHCENKHKVRFCLSSAKAHVQHCLPHIRGRS